MMILATNLLVGNLIERVNSEVGAVSARLTEAVQGWMAARSRGRSSRPKGRDKARQAKRKPGDAAAALDGGLQSAAAGAERLSSPQRAILDDLARAAPRRAAGETERRLAGRPPACALEPAAAAGARRPQGLPSRASRTYPSGGPPASGAPAELAPAAPEPRGAREVDPEYLSLMEQVDEQDDMPVLLAEAHGLGPTFYEYNEMALQFGYICMFSVSFPPAALLALGNNVVEFTADAHKLLRGHRRCATRCGLQPSLLASRGRAAAAPRPLPSVAARGRRPTPPVCADAPGATAARAVRLAGSSTRARWASSRGATSSASSRWWAS